MHNLEKLVRVETVLLHQAAQRRAVAAVVVLLQPKRLVVRDLEEIDDVIANANVDLLPQIEMMRVKRVVEIEDPILEGLEICRSGARLGCRLLPRLFVAIFVTEEVRSLPNHRK